MVTEALIARCMRQEPKAQFELYGTLHPLLMSICSRYERDRQEAAARLNQGFLKILQSLGSRRPEVPFTAWASRIMINTVIDDFRRDKIRRATEVTYDRIEPSTTVDANEYLQQMEADAFADLLMRVPPMSRDVFNLFAIDGYSHAEISELLGISEGTSKWHVSQARSILRKALTELAEKSTIRTSAR
jgi:RNA polymerase sigma factor (sigma-70 family)